MKLRVLDLFSGIGGFSLGLERTGGFETVAFCEFADFPLAVLAKHWPDVPIFPDVRELKGTDIEGPVDVICGGYPCQPFSTAGQRRGAEDDRHLWPEFSRLVDELRPTWVIGENVAGHISMGLDDVLSDLEGQGYACRTFVIPACAVDAPHRRDRVWTVGYDSNAKSAGADKMLQPRSGLSLEFRGVGGGETLAHSAQLQCDGGGKHWQQGQRQVSQSGKRSGPVDVADADSAGLQGRQKAGNSGGQRKGRNKQPERCFDMPRAIWLPEPDVGRVANGVSQRVDRLKGLGNAIVPQIATLIGEAILNAR